MSAQLKFEETLETHQCGKCGVFFAMPEKLAKERLKTKESFYCPNGHPRVFSGKSDAEKAREETEEVKKRLSAALARENELQREYNKVKKRMKNGVCPCCNRSFVKLAQHMKTKHPDFQ